MNTLMSDNFYGNEITNQCTFFKNPWQLITDPHFKWLSTDAKLLYGMLLDRMGLANRNDWYDDTRQVYIYYTIKEICENIGCEQNKTM